jgi:triacylglycerol esterase/lipase EstA (alpha/beta hydrolase family)
MQARLLNLETRKNDMATQTQDAGPVRPRGAVGRWTETTRKAGNDYLDAYGKTVVQLADYGVKAAAAAKLPVVTELAESQAKLSRNLVETYITVTRDLLKA